MRETLPSPTVTDPVWVAAEAAGPRQLIAVRFTSEIKQRFALANVVYN
jgi:hypothetical protein